MNRRDALKTLGALATTAGMSKLLSGCGADEDATIDTFVFMMMENRTYDHYLGSRALREGLAGDGLESGMSNPDLEGAQIEIMAATDMLCVIDPPHGWDASHAQFGGGANDGFVTTHQLRHGAGDIEPMQYLLREHIPVTHALADAHVSCDRWFSSLMCGTLPNRMYWHAATSNGAKVNDEVIAGAFEGVPTLYHRLDAAGVEWAYYYGDVPVLGVVEDLETEGRIRRFMPDFLEEAAAGTLPPVCYIDPSFTFNDDHPPHHPLLGQQLIAAVYQALATSPQWKRSMLVVTYDEHGGFFDHVPPPTAADDRAADGFDQLGFRVPTLVAGPYVKQGYVSSVQYDHTSALKHLENEFGLDPLTARSSAANDLLDCIDLERLARGKPAAPIELPAIEVDESHFSGPCSGSSLRQRGGHDHDILRWADQTSRLGKLDLRHEARDYIYGIGEYLDRHGLGRIRRR